MLFLTRLPEKAVHIGDEITVKVIDHTTQHIETEVTISGETAIHRTAIGDRLPLTDRINILLRLSTYNQVQLGITAPQHIPVHREEVLARIMKAVRKLSIYEIWADPKDQQSPAIHTYIVARDQTEALAHFSHQFDREWLISPWVVTTHWQPELMEFVDAGMDHSDNYKALRSACLLRKPPFVISLPHLHRLEVAA